MEQILELENEFKRKSRDPTKVLIEAEFTLLEQKFKQQREDQMRLKNSLKKIKTSTFNYEENQDFDFEKVMNEINSKNENKVVEKETDVLF